MLASRKLPFGWPKPGSTQPRLSPLVTIGALWLAGVMVGVGLLWAYSHTAGDLDSPPSVWPADSRLPHRAGRPTLVFFAHPQCPCTLASLRELDRLLAQAGEPIDALVVFVKPDGMPDDWTQSKVWSLAKSMPGVLTSIDPGGVESHRFAAQTSGQVCLYGEDNQLLFHGGITSARGHEGASTGRSSILAILRDEDADACSPVFGCPLHAPVQETEG